ncbi:MAG: DUF4421 family protein, partial [Flavobacteriales bacterium]|nr:DUF4421 family protein [Flavobacteriales bacterium]
LLNGDSTRGPGYDTAYVTSYRDDLCISLVTAYQGSSIDIDRTDGATLTYSTNTPMQYGASIDYKWLGVEATFTVPGLSQLDPDLGATEARGLGFGFTGRRWWFRNFILASEGFYPEEPRQVDPDWQEGRPYPFRPDLENLTYMAGIHRGFNGRKFSYTAARTQTERQKRSAGSWTAGATFWFSRTRGSSGLLPVFDLANYSTAANVRSVRRWLFCLTGGYAHTFALWHHGFVHLMVVPGLGAQQQALQLADREERSTGWTFAASTEFRMGLGWNADRWYAAMSLVAYESAGAVSEDVDLSTSIVNLHLATGWRFRHIKPLWRQLGL